MSHIGHNLSILFIGMVNSCQGHSTTKHRYKALLDLGFKVDVIDTTGTPSFLSELYYRVCNKLFNLGLPVKLPDLERNNRRLISQIGKYKYELIWIEKNLVLEKKTFDKIRSLLPKVKIIGFSPDDMNARHNQSYNFLQTLPLYDFFITTKSYNVMELTALGAKKVIFINNGYDPETFHPYSINHGDLPISNNGICFIGTYEESRALFLLHLAENGLIVNVYGDNWHKFKRSHVNLIIHYIPLYGEDFAKACSFFKINLCFLRKINRDLQTTRSVEIPACCAFMLAERSVEHDYLFLEGYEAEYFSTKDELLSKCLFYLNHDSERIEIAKHGLERCKKSKYSNTERIMVALEDILHEIE